MRESRLGLEMMVPCLVHRNSDKHNHPHNRLGLGALVIGTSAVLQKWLRTSSYSNDTRHVQLCTLVFKFHGLGHYSCVPWWVKRKGLMIGQSLLERKERWMGRASKAGLEVEEGSLSSTQELKHTHIRNRPQLGAFMISTFAILHKFWQLDLIPMRWVTISYAY